MNLSVLKKGVLSFAALGLLTTGIAGCGGGGSGGGGYYSGGVVIFDPGYKAWYDVYGNACSTSAPRPGCNFYANGLKIIDIEDPYFYSGFYLSYDNFYFYDSYGFPSLYRGWAWESPNGIIYDDWGDALNNQDGKGRDFEADVAKAEKNVVMKAAQHFQAKYELTADTSMKVARILHDWAKIGKDRARTEKDIADFTQRLYGIDLNQVKNALAEVQKGEKKAFENLVDETATNWGTTPETMKEILKTWYGDQLDSI